MYLEKEYLHITIDELSNKGIDVTKLLSNDIDEIAKKMVQEFNNENLSCYKFDRIYALVDGQLVIKVSS